MRCFVQPLALYTLLIGKEQVVKAFLPLKYLHNTATPQLLRTMASAASTDAEKDSPGISDIGKYSNSDDNQLLEATTSWRDRIEVSMAKCRKIRGSNYVQLATVDAATQEPRCRTVVFRGFVVAGDDSRRSNNLMRMITDQRSAKVKEGGETPAAELVWWFPKSSEQYRIRGRLHFIGKDGVAKETLGISPHLRKETWGNLSDAAREQFYWEEPGSAFDSKSNGTKSIPTSGRSEDGKVLEPPENFLLMILDPFRVDYLNLRNNFRQIDTLVSEKDTWAQQQVHP